jgi:hypothetical protein
MICWFSVAMLCASDVTSLASLCQLRIGLGVEALQAAIVALQVAHQLLRLRQERLARRRRTSARWLTVCNALTRLCSCEDSPLLVLPSRLSTAAAWVEKLLSWL